MEKEIANYVGTAKEDRGAWLKETTLLKLERSGLTYTLVKNGDVAVFRIPNSMTVDFYTRKNRWRVRGYPKTTHGTVDEFIAWFRTELGYQA